MYLKWGVTSVPCAKLNCYQGLRIVQQFSSAAIDSRNVLMLLAVTQLVGLIELTLLGARFN